MSAPTIDAQTFRSWIEDGEELAVLDLRDAAAFGKGEPLYATNLPADRVEAEIGRHIPRHAVRTVLVDDRSGIAVEIAEKLARAGRSHVVALAGGVPAWLALGEGLPTFDTPGVVFSLAIRDERGTPVVSAAELKQWRDAGKDVVVLDTRTVEEFTRDHVPGAISVPGAELLLRFTDLVPSPETQVLVSCAGLPRAIIGAQTLIDGGVPNKVAYLDDGTAGWRKAGLALETGATRLYGPVSEAARRAAESFTARIAAEDAIPEIDEATARAWRNDEGRTTYWLDVRTPEEFEASHLPGSISSEGGQLLGVSYRTIAVRGARVVLIDEPTGTRAATTAHWLKRRGFEIAILKHDFAGSKLAAVA
ncbi:rhodanese-like domain-containing protein [Kaistia dalseonensis]|nr:rhodanese-like domain-containing protein [Kaistia dalseonensis]MCX5493685.1 rhodanese-like domain-containing protein [Kaistia dalseonensis]